MTNLAKYIDHTLLSSAATKQDVVKLCNEAKNMGFMLFASSRTG